MRLPAVSIAVDASGPSTSSGAVSVNVNLAVSTSTSTNPPRPLTTPPQLITPQQLMAPPQLMTPPQFMAPQQLIVPPQPSTPPALRAPGQPMPPRPLMMPRLVRPSRFRMPANLNQPGHVSHVIRNLFPDPNNASNDQEVPNLPLNLGARVPSSSIAQASGQVGLSASVYLLMGNPSTSFARPTAPAPQNPMHHPQVRMGNLQEQDDSQQVPSMSLSVSVRTTGTSGARASDHHRQPGTQPPRSTQWNPPERD